MEQRTFSRGGEGGGGRIFKKKISRIFKNFQEFCRPSFKSTKLIFRALPKHYKDPVLAKIKKRNRPKKAFLGTFWKTLTKKLRFFRLALPPQI